VNKATTRILLIIVVLALAAMACVGGGGGGGSGTGSGSNGSASSQPGEHSPDATATFGAEQLHIQLTEIARQANK
jgi:hypothetical protein